MTADTLSSATATPIGPRLRTAREAAKLTQQQVASYLDCDHTTISKIEGSRFDPSLDTLRQLILLYRSRGPLDLDFLFFGLTPHQVRLLAIQSYGA